MSKDESILSGISGAGVGGGSQAHLVKVLANVVETQKSVASQFSALFDRVEEARNETRRSVAALTDEIRKLEIRSSTMFEKVTTQLITQNEALNTSHAAERAQLIAQNDNMLNLLKSTINNAPRPAPVNPQPMNTYNQALTASSMFGPVSSQDQQLIDQFNQLTPNQIVGLQTQIRQMQQLQIQQQQQHQAMLASRAAASSTTIAAPSVPTAAVPSVPVVPPASTVTSVPPPVVVTQQSAPKVELKPVEVKPVVPSPATTVVPAKPSPSTTVAPAKPMYSFGSPSAASKPIFGGSMAPAAAPVATAAAAASPFSFVAPKPAIKVEAKEETGDDDNDDVVEEYEPDVQFTPVIPLPDMVETVTGEESEKVLFEDRCKLFRFTNGEWKERATGNLKVLKNEKTGKHRVVVRRDQMVLVSLEDGFHAQVHKVAANFNLVPGLKIAPMKTSPKAVVWFCRDFSENEDKGEDEQLSARFASPQQAEEFMDLVNTIIEDMPKSSATPKKAESIKPAVPSAGAKVEIPKAEEPKKSAVVAPAATPAASAWGDKFKMTAGEWECAACYVRSAADAAVCSCCGTANPNCEKKESDKPANPFGKNATIFNPSAASGSNPNFSFGLGGGSSASASASSASASTASLATTTSSKAETIPAASSPATFSFASSAASSAATASPAPATPKFSFMQAAAAATKEDEKKPLFGSSAPSAASNVFGAGVATAATGASTFSFKSAATPAAESPLTSFSFKTPDPSKSSIFGGSSKTLFGASSPATPVETKKPEEEKKETPGSVFGSSFMSGGQPTSVGFSGLTGRPSIFDQQDKVAEGQKNFASLAKSKPFGQSAAVAAASTVTSKDEDGEEGNPEEYEPDVQFAPVIPLPDLVEVKTGEENETVLFSARSKIFRYVRETKEYKERGVGDLKLLHDEANNKFRVVMRRDQVHKLCANFSVLKTAKLITKEGQDNVRSIVVTDFAENENGDMESLCLKFKNAEVAKEFENAFEDARAQLQ